jgi:hypothetical protein
VKVTRNGEPLNVPVSLILGLILVVIGLGNRLWGLAIVGGIFLGYWLLKRYPPGAQHGAELLELRAADDASTGVRLAAAGGL